MRGSSSPMGNSDDGERVENLKEAELIARAQRGDRAAFAALVRAHQDEVYTLARRLVGDPHMAADIAQETLVRAWRALPRFRGDAKLSTWLHRITVNTAWTHRDRARRNAAVPIDDVVERPALPGPDDPETAGELMELRGRLRSALETLPEGQRQVVVMKDVYGWSHGEIAEAMGISVTAAKVRLHRARARLANELEESA
jgi:RNA polymerase sigma-70 factor, ECF subfamily